MRELFQTLIVIHALVLQLPEVSPPRLHLPAKKPGRLGPRCVDQVRNVRRGSYNVECEISVGPRIPMHASLGCYSAQSPNHCLWTQHRSTPSTLQLILRQPSQQPHLKYRSCSSTNSSACTLVKNSIPDGESRSTKRLVRSAPKLITPLK